VATRQAGGQWSRVMQGPEVVVIMLMVIQRKTLPCCRYSTNSDVAQLSLTVPARVSSFVLMMPLPRWYLQVLVPQRS
jgi:hypothetical protein